MSRPWDWSALGRAHDPAPGDQVAVAALARRYADTAAAIEDQAGRLRRMGASSWKGKAGDAFRSRAGELAEHIEKARGRYESAAEAVGGFAREMAEPQRQSAAALRRAEAAQQELAATVPLPAGPPPSADAPPPTPAQQQAAAAEHRAAASRASAHQHAVEELAAARQSADDAAHDYERAAKKAHDALHSAVQHDGVHDSWWDRNAHWVKSALKVLAVVILVLVVIAIVVATCGAGGVLLGGAFFSSVGLAGVSVGAALETLIAAATVLSLTGHVALAATDKGSWKDVAIDVAALATLGLGRLLLGGKAVFGLGKGIPSLTSATAKAEALARSVAGGRAGAAVLRGKGLPGVLYRLSGHGRLLRLGERLLPGLDDAVRAGDEAASAARSAVQVSGKAPRLVRVLTEGDKEIAEHLRALRELNRQAPAVLRNQARELAALAGGGGKLASDAYVFQYGLRDAVKQLWTEPRERAEVGHHAHEVTSAYSGMSGHVR